MQRDYTRWRPTRLPDNAGNRGGNESSSWRSKPEGFEGRSRGRSLDGGDGNARRGNWRSKPEGSEGRSHGRSQCEDGDARGGNWRAKSGGFQRKNDTIYQTEAGAASNENSALKSTVHHERKGVRSNNEFREKRNFPFKYVEDLLEKSLEDILVKLYQNTAFFEYIGKTLSHDYIVLIVDLLSKISDSQFPKNRIVTMQAMISSGFLNNLKSYIAGLPFQSLSEKKKNSYYWKNPDSFWNNLLKCCTASIDEFPHFFVDHMLTLVKISLSNITQIENQHKVHISDEIKIHLQSLIDRGDQIIAKHNQKQYSNKREITGELELEEEPPDNFRHIDIFPSTHELLQNEPGYLRKNIIIGSYRDVNHYLDVQFRLLREDFVGPLRAGIQGYLTGKKFRDIQDIRIYPKVQFLNPIAATEDYCVLVKFHFGGKLSNFKFEDSRKFMFGSLVCFSNDQFKTILFGRIVDRKIDFLKKGELVIGFNKMEIFTYNTDYVMVECGVYFEPYYLVLKVLKEIREEDFPMRNYIVDVDKSVLIPKFASANTVYRVRDKDAENYLRLVGIHENCFFPCFNNSQNAAFIAALTRQFSIIQGPPGTGKTYVGLKVAKTLIYNCGIWCKNSPMLIICYTNHALDQFLEGLIDTTQQIVRIGGQSKNEKLKKFNLKEHIKKSYKTARNPAISRAKQSVSFCLERMKNVTDMMNAISNKNCILDIKRFSRVIPNYDGSWLAAASSTDFLEWLLNQNISGHEDHVLANAVMKQLEKVTIEDSDEEDDDGRKGNEDNEFTDLLKNIGTITPNSLLDVTLLSQQITSVNLHLMELKSEMEENEDKIFLYLTLESRREKLQIIYDSIMKYMTMVPDTNVERMSIVNSRYLPIEDRWNLYFYWIRLYNEDLLREHEQYSEEYRRAFAIYNELKDMGNLEILRRMNVIGMTTTSAARLHSSLQLLKCPVVIVEEAAEVLEAHIVSALTKDCQQLILIGDHQQLRPSTANYRIETKYNLGISMFERMVRNDVQCFTLDTQHRMRPEISALITPTIYPNLKNHDSVLNRPLIKGVEKCLFFIDHQFLEESNKNTNQSVSTSKKNIHEVTFLVQLAKYLILNGYEPDQITILAAYLGQMFEIQKEKKKSVLLQNVRVSVLDNYQGEESDIILLSLVRSNNENSIGFLSIENRVCVALSRARNGLYIMGNMTQLCNKSELWRKIQQTLLSQEAIGSSLALKCQNHSKITMVTTADDFSLVSEGGCDLMCNNSLVCGHRCKMQCHVLDGDHLEYCCLEKCNRPLCDSDPTHLCMKHCGQECGPCEYPKHVTLDCGHQAVIKCHENPEEHACTKQILVTLPCQHDALKPCHVDVNEFKCQIPCDARLDCGHSCIKNCHIFQDPDHLTYKCMKPCTKFRKGCTNLEDDEHKCSLRCYENCEPCKKLVRKARTCSHLFDVPCLENVNNIVCHKPCKKKLSCGHQCRNECSDVCTTKCERKVEKTIPECNHIIKLPCHQEPTRWLCSNKCPRIMDCGHNCGGTCKEQCDISKCKEIVDLTVLAKCGHIVSRVPCFVKTLYRTKGEGPSLKLESYCTAPCESILNCSLDEGHRCSGTCGTCYQGRIHKRCAEKCKRRLICDHECKGLCREACKPCSLVCSFKCKHSTCKKRCGDKCIICKEQCNRRCVHQKCTKKCGEICNVPPCEMPCEKKIKRCGHPCIGFCSEPCPPLCRICDKEEVEEILFGTEDEEGARFVLLNDCGHILEDEGMKGWLNQDQEEIQLPFCPKCKTKIFRTERYNDYVKKAVEGISRVKLKAIGNDQEINMKCVVLKNLLNSLDLIHCVRNFHVKLYDCRKTLLDRLQKVNNKGRVQHLNLVDLNAIEIKFQLLERVFQIMNLDEVTLLTRNYIAVEEQVDLILTNLLREIDDITKSEIEDLTREIDRLHRMIQMLPLLVKYSESNFKNEIMELKKYIYSLKRYEKEIDDIVKEELKKLRKLHTMLPLTELEKREIVKAMGLRKGHWYQCPNGHPYVIGECGGANQVSNCPACGAQIGGSYHRLLDTNRVATFMDGATHGAWSEHMNMQNFVLDD